MSAADKHRLVAEKHAGQVGRIHNTMKRAMDRIVAVDTSNLSGATLTNFMVNAKRKQETTHDSHSSLQVFVKAFAVFLHSHHDHEETIFFPVAVQKEPERVRFVVFVGGSLSF